MITYNPYKLFCGSFVPNWLSERLEISAAAKLCFARLSQYAGEDGECFPKIETLAKAIGAQKRATQRYLRELEKFKLIKTIRQGPHLPNKYIFLTHPWIQGVTNLTPLEVTNLTPLYKENNINKKKYIKKKSENQNVQTETKKLKEQAKEVLQYLNEKSLSRFRFVDCNLNYVISRLKEKVSVRACKGVIDMKVKEWKNTEMEKYLRPSTLFRLTNFENYYGKYLSTARQAPSEKVLSKPTVYNQTEIDKYYPISDNLPTYKRKYNTLQREGIQAMVREGLAIIH